MKHWTKGNNVFVVLDKGEKIIESLIALAEEKNIKSATFTGIGAADRITLGYFDVEACDYERKEFPFSMELGTLIGNIAQLDGKPFVHAHATICGPDFSAYTGHLFEGTISVTGEIVITKHPVEMQRSLDENIGLNLIKLK
ncbi:MAG: DNA-binding protein [Planctomycetota bacterium]|nr:MAG: DNA-binding protein [Planctomycetota bacterium]